MILLLQSRIASEIMCHLEAAPTNWMSSTKVESLELGTPYEAHGAVFRGRTHYKVVFSKCTLISFHETIKDGA